MLVSLLLGVYLIFATLVSHRVQGWSLGACTALKF